VLHLRESRSAQSPQDVQSGLKHDVFELLAARILEHKEELALIDAVDSGNAIAGMRGDMMWTADSLHFFAGLITEIKGETFSQGPRHLNFTRREPYGVVAKINPFNHPFRFCAEKAAAPLAAGNCVVIKGSEQAPISSLKLGELQDDGAFGPTTSSNADGERWTFTVAKGISTSGGEA